MARRLKASTASDDSAVVKALCSSSQQIWLAGLGAFARARKEGGDMLAKLLKEGAALQRRTRHLPENQGFGVADAMATLAENAGRQATGSLEKFEKIFEDRVSHSLRSLGVPMRDDIEALSGQIDELNRSINALTGKKTAPRRRMATTAGKLPVKAAVKRAAIKGTARMPPQRRAKSAAG